MTNNSSDRLTRIEGILESMAQQQEETRAIVNSNSRAIQAMMDQRVQERLEHEQRMQRLEEILNRVANVQEGLGRMLVSLDDDRPTILRKLNSIENKVDRLLEGDQG